MKMISGERFYRGKIGGSQEKMTIFVWMALEEENIVLDITAVLKKNFKIYMLKNTYLFLKIQTYRRQKCIN